MTDHTGGPVAQLFNVEAVVTVVTPEMTPDWHVFALRLKRMDYSNSAEDADRWAVERHHEYLGTDGEWSWRNSLDDEWVATHYLPYQEALALAQKHCPDVSVNGHVAHKVASRWAADQLTRWGEENQPNG